MKIRMISKMLAYMLICTIVLGGASGCQNGGKHVSDFTGKGTDRKHF